MKNFEIYDDAGTPNLLYSSTVHLPAVDPPDIDRKLKYAIFDGINGDKTVYGLLRSGKYDQRLAETFTFTFDYLEEELSLVLSKYNASLAVLQFHYDTRWRKLECAILGNRTITVNAGYLLYASDCFWLLTDYILTVNTNDTKVYVTPSTSTGLLTVDSDTSVPAGSTEIATIVATGSDPVIITSSTTGVSNIRKGKILDYKTILKPASYKGVEITVLEVLY